MVDRKTIAYIIIFKVTLITAFLLLVLPIYPSENTIDLKSGVDLITEHFEPEEIACIQIFDPVCGVDGITYSNSCFADVAGVEIDHEGQC